MCSLGMIHCLMNTNSIVTHSSLSLLTLVNSGRKQILQEAIGIAVFDGLGQCSENICIINDTIEMQELLVINDPLFLYFIHNLHIYNL